MVLQESQTISRDNNLQRLINTFEQANIEVDHITSVSELLHAALIATTIQVGYKLLEREVILLPAVHNKFQTYTTELAAGSNLQDSVTSVSAMWLLSGLTTNFEHHMTYSCKIRKYGTLLYRPNTDLLPSLQKAMWTIRQLEVTKGELQSQLADAKLQARSKSTCTSQDGSSRKVLDELNDDVHSEIRRQLAKISQTPFEHDQLDIDASIEEADPQLWEAICLLTRSVSERKQSELRYEPASQSKKLRRFFLLCSLLFCSDDRCSLPLHTLVTDVVDSQGGSALLIRILNRLGVCSSLDTLSRYIQYHVTKSKDLTGSGLNPASFTVVSADNIDFLHSFARVFCGKQTSSWHGTSIQAAQPLPSLSLVEENSMLLDFARMEVCQSHSQSRKRSEKQSPQPSPSKLTRSPMPKMRRRMRTGTEKFQQAGNTSSNLQQGPSSKAQAFPPSTGLTETGRLPQAFPPSTGPTEIRRLPKAVLPPTGLTKTGRLPQVCQSHSQSRKRSEKQSPNTTQQRSRDNTQPWKCSLEARTSTPGGPRQKVSW